MRAKQKGTALLSVLLVTALATVLLTANVQRSRELLDFQALSQDHFQLNELRRYTEHRAIQQLEEMRSLGNAKMQEQLSNLALGGNFLLNSSYELTPSWHYQVRVHDLHSKLNINRLIHNQAYRDAFNNLIAGMSGPDAYAVADWLDADTDIGPLGAEDFSYLSRTPAYLPANRAAIRASEIRLVLGMNAEAWRQIKPYIVALPSREKTNINSAPEKVIRALAPTLDSYSIVASRNLDNSGFTSEDDFTTADTFAGAPEARHLFTTTSRYFDLEFIFTRGQSRYYFKSRIDIQNRENPVIQRLPALDIESWLYEERQG